MKLSWFLPFFIFTVSLTLLVTGCDEFTLHAPPVAPYAGVWKPGASFNYGDSITACFGVTHVENCYVNRLTNYLGSGPTTDRAFAGDQACDVGNRQVFNQDSPAIVPVQPLRTLMVGTNDVDIGEAGPYEATFNLCHRAVISWLGTPASSKILGAEVVDTSTGSCTTDETYPVANGIACTSSGSTAQFSITTTGSPVYIWYRVIDGDTGEFTYSIDGAPPATLTTGLTPVIKTLNGVTHSVALARVPIAAGGHIVRFVQSTAGTMSIIGVGTIPSNPGGPLPVLVVGDIPSQLNGVRQAGIAAYRKDITDNISLLAADGLKVTFAPVSKFVLCNQWDMYDLLHPNDFGHAELFAAFAAGIQQLPGAAKVD